MNLALGFAFFFALTIITQGRAEGYYFYEGPKGEPVIPNKEPPPGSKITKRLPEVTDWQVPQAQAQERGKTTTTAQIKAAPKPSKNKQP